MNARSRTFRFQRLLNLAEQLAEQAKQQLRSLRNQMRERQDRIQQWVEEVKAMHGPAKDTGQSGSVQAWKACSLYVVRLRKRVEVEQELLTKLEDEYQQALAVYLQRRQRQKSLELLRDKQETLRRQHQERRQQLEMDDFVLARAEPDAPRPV